MTHVAALLQSLRKRWWSAILAAASAYSLAQLGPLAHAADEDRNSVPIRGVVRAVNQATLSTDTPLMVLDVPFRDGARFKRGDVLAAFDCRRLLAEHGAAAAIHREAVLNLETSRQLDRFKAVAKNDVEIAGARTERAKHELEALEARLDECNLVAPFDGRVVEIGVRRYERTVPQRPYLSIIDDSRLEIETIVPSHMLAVLTVGIGFTFRIDELDGRVAQTRVSSIAAAVDPVSKTVKVVGAIDQSVPGLLAGMSGTAQFSTGR